MGGGNGAKAKQARERAAKTAKKGPTTNIGSNDLRKKCQQCPVGVAIFSPQHKKGPGGMIEHHTTMHPTLDFDSLFIDVNASGKKIG